jgi:hypothetical protein
MVITPLLANARRPFYMATTPLQCGSRCYGSTLERCRSPVGGSVEEKMQKPIWIGGGRFAHSLPFQNFED